MLLFLQMTHLKRHRFEEPKERWHSFSRQHKKAYFTFAFARFSCPKLPTMLARPAAAALSCCGCRQALFRAVAGASRHKFIAGGISQTTAPRLPTIPRNFSTTQRKRADDNPPKASKEESAPEAKDESQNDDTPWFLEEKPPRHPPSQHLQPLPKIPENAPAVLEPMLKYVFEDMGLDDLGLLALRDLDPPAALGDRKSVV